MGIADYVRGFFSTGADISESAVNATGADHGLVFFIMALVILWIIFGRR